MTTRTQADRLRRACDRRIITPAELAESLAALDAGGTCPDVAEEFEAIVINRSPRWPLLLALVAATALLAAALGATAAAMVLAAK